MNLIIFMKVLYRLIFFQYQVSDDDEDELCSDTNNLSQNDKSDTGSVSKSKAPTRSGT